VEKCRRVRPDTDDYDTCSLHGGNLRLQHALRLCNIYCCPVGTNVIRTIHIVTVYVHCYSVLTFVMISNLKLTFEKETLRKNQEDLLASCYRRN